VTESEAEVVFTSERFN